MSRRWMLLAVVSAAVLALGPTAAAGASRMSAPTVTSQDVTISISGQNCDEMSPDATLEGTGTLTTVTRVHDIGGGATAISTVDVATGMATDQDGATYRWYYDNRTWTASSADDPTAFEGVMVDVFVLAGDGPELIDNGFLATYAYDVDDETAVRIEPWQVWGDPLDFAALEARCDPL
jgi:hypothetical protein